MTAICCAKSGDSMALSCSWAGEAVQRGRCGAADTAARSIVAAAEQLQHVGCKCSAGLLLVIMLFGVQLSAYPPRSNWGVHL